MQELGQEFEVCLYFDVNLVGWKKKDIFKAPIPEREREKKWIEYRDKMEETLDRILEFIYIYGRQKGYGVRDVERNADEIIVKIEVPYNKDIIQEVINTTNPLREYFKKETNGEKVSIGVGLEMDDAQDACKDAKLRSGVEISHYLKDKYPELNKLKIPDIHNESPMTAIINNNYF